MSSNLFDHTVAIRSVDLDGLICNNVSWPGRFNGVLLPPNISSLYRKRLIGRIWFPRSSWKLSKTLTDSDAWNGISPWTSSSSAATTPSATGANVFHHLLATTAVPGMVNRFSCPLSQILLKSKFVKQRSPTNQALLVLAREEKVVHAIGDEILPFLLNKVMDN